eukprot:41755-Eustigmatos_ZCMA.PRE.1
MISALQRRDCLRCRVGHRQTVALWHMLADDPCCCNTNALCTTDQLWRRPSGSLRHMLADAPCCCHTDALCTTDPLWRRP